MMVYTICLYGSCAEARMALRDSIVSWNNFGDICRAVLRQRLSNASGKTAYSSFELPDPSTPELDDVFPLSPISLDANDLLGSIPANNDARCRATRLESHASILSSCWILINDGSEVI